MPRPLGRDRLEPATPGDGEGAVVLGSPREKGWEGRVEGRVVMPGTAVRWDEEIWEVVSVGQTGSGGFRYVLVPWDERNLVRRVVDYAPEALSNVKRAPEFAQPPTSADPGSTGHVPPPAAANAWLRIPATLRPLVAALPVALVAPYLCPLRVMGDGMSAFAHELGHTFASWIFGRLAIPAAIVTIHFEQSRILAAVLWAGLLFLTWKARTSLRSARSGLRTFPTLFFSLCAASAIYPLLAFTRGYDQFTSAMGHGGEILAVCILLRLAMYGRGDATERETWERPVYAFFAWYLWIRNVKLFAGIAFDREARTDYLTIAITGDNDFVKLAREWSIPLEKVALVVALLALVVPVVAFLVSLGRKPEENI
jgi:hypothetical protein